jgi:hypothetical protein
MQKTIQIFKGNIFKNPFDKGDTLIAKYFEKLYKGEFICSKDHKDLRKMVFMIRKQGYPIQKLNCDCDDPYIHGQYYWEFGIDVNPQ